MSGFANHAIDRNLDLVLERVIDISPDKVWAGWTQPALIMKWFTPAPWQTIDCTIDLRPGGVFYTLMRSPEGLEFPNRGCILEVVENERLVMTDTLGAGWRPAAGGFFTALVVLEPHGVGGTKYTAITKHADEAARQKHEDMGFHTGWGKALDQLVALVKSG